MQKFTATSLLLLSVLFINSKATAADKAHSAAPPPINIKLAKVLKDPAGIYALWTYTVNDPTIAANKVYGLRFTAPPGSNYAYLDGIMIPPNFTNYLNTSYTPAAIATFANISLVGSTESNTYPSDPYHPNLPYTLFTSTNPISSAPTANPITKAGTFTMYIQATADHFSSLQPVQFGTFDGSNFTEIGEAMLPCPNFHTPGTAEAKSK